MTHVTCHIIYIHEWWSPWIVSLILPNNQFHSENAKCTQMLLLIQKYLSSKVSLSVSCSLSIVIFSERGVIGNIMHHVMTLGALFSAAGNINCNQDDNNISAFIILSALQCCCRAQVQVQVQVRSRSGRSEIDLSLTLFLVFITTHLPTETFFLALKGSRQVRWT